MSAGEPLKSRLSAQSWVSPKTWTPRETSPSTPAGEKGRAGQKLRKRRGSLCHHPLAPVCNTHTQTQAPPRPQRNLLPPPTRLGAGTALQPSQAHRDASAAHSRPWLSRTRGHPRAHTRYCCFLSRRQGFVEVGEEVSSLCSTLRNPYSSPVTTCLDPFRAGAGVGGTQVSYDEGSSGLTSIQSLARGSWAGSPAFRPGSLGINRQAEWLSFMMLLPGLQHLGLECFSWMIL